MHNYAVTYFRPSPSNGNVPWKDNKGDSGYVLTTIYHTQDYYPDSPGTASYTLGGTLLPSSNVDTSNYASVTSNPFAYGYCDNTPGGNPVDIATAVDSLGNKVKLKGIDFVKIQTGIEANLGLLGEFSTEVSAVWDVHLLAIPASRNRSSDYANGRRRTAVRKRKTHSGVNVWHQACGGFFVSGICATVSPGSNIPNKVDQ